MIYICGICLSQGFRKNNKAYLNFRTNTSKWSITTCNLTSHFDGSFDIIHSAPDSLDTPQMMERATISLEHLLHNDAQDLLKTYNASFQRPLAVSFQIGEQSFSVGAMENTLKESIHDSICRTCFRDYSCWADGCKHSGRWWMTAQQRKKGVHYGVRWGGGGGLAALSHTELHCGVHSSLLQSWKSTWRNKCCYRDIWKWTLWYKCNRTIISCDLE